MLNGSTSGYMNCRANIQLYNGTTSLGYVRFYEPNKAIPADSESGGSIFMNMPDLLRNESPLFFYFGAGSAYLSTDSREPVGEGES